MSIKLKVRHLLLALIVGVLLSNCTKAYIPKDTESNLSPAINGTDTIKYQPHISFAISNNCIGCHGGSNPQGGLSLENYNQVRNSTENGMLIQRINDASDPMPPSGLLPSQTRLLFDRWVQNGYLEN
jgi:hypothetical protein